MKSCINCTERHIGCHSTCERHKNELKETKAIKDKKRKGDSSRERMDFIENIIKDLKENLG